MYGHGYGFIVSCSSTFPVASGAERHDNLVFHENHGRGVEVELLTLHHSASLASQQPGGARRHVFDLKEAMLASQILPGPIVSDLAGGRESKRQSSRRVIPVEQAHREVI